MPDLEQRQHPRFQTRIFGVFAADIDVNETEMLMTNLSLGGAFVRTDEPAPPGSTVTLMFYLPTEDTPISVIGEVVWWRPSAEHGEPGMGVKFVQGRQEDFAKLKHYITLLVEQELFHDKT